MVGRDRRARQGRSKEIAARKSRVCRCSREYANFSLAFTSTSITDSKNFGHDMSMHCAGVSNIGPLCLPAWARWCLFRVVLFIFSAATFFHRSLPSTFVCIFVLAQ